jgi:hypothetical protein
MELRVDYEKLLCDERRDLSVFFRPVIVYILPQINLCAVAPDFTARFSRMADHTEYIPDI